MASLLFMHFWEAALLNRFQQFANQLGTKCSYNSTTYAESLVYTVFKEVAILISASISDKININIQKCGTLKTDIPM